MRIARGLAAVFTIGIATAVLYSYSTGPDPRNTGAPGDQTCVSCHLGTLNGGGGRVQIVSSSGASYTPGQQQTFTIQITDSSARAYGFQMTARLDSNAANGQAGDFTAGPQQFVLCQNGNLKGNGCSASAPVQFIEHNRPFSTNTITAAWTAPSSDVGTVTIYVAANAANLDGNNTGDHIYTSSLQLAPVAPVTVKPSIAPGGVVAASAFNANAGVAPGTWLEIFGSGLSTSTRGWEASDFSGNNAPTSLDGVGVTIGGKAAYVDFISPGQVNVQVPDGIPMGSGVPLILTNSQGRSDPYPLTTASLAPALLAPPSFTANGKQYVVAIFATNTNGITFAAPTGAISGVNSRPAKPGDVLTLFGIGFGPLSSGIGAGVLQDQAANLTNPITVLFGQTPATILYAGAAPGFTGLYQFNIQVPNAGAGDWPLVVQLGGTNLNQNIVVSTGQ